MNETYLGTSNTWDYDWVGNRLDPGRTYNQVDQLNAGSGFEYDLKGSTMSRELHSCDPVRMSCAHLLSSKLKAMQR